MLDFILANPEYKNINVKRKMTIRSTDIRTADVIPEEALREQIEATATLDWVSEVDISFLRGMTNPNWWPLFQKETLEFLKTFKLPEYTIDNDGKWNYELTFTGPRSTSLMREIYGLKIINSLYLYHYIKKEKLSNSEFSEIITRTMGRLYDDIATFKTEPELTFSEFGTRRGMSTDFHKMIFEVLSERLPHQCVGTSNVLFSREFGRNNPKGTNAHELRMIPTALYDDPQKIIDTMYDVDRQRGKHFPWLWILLPDTYGTSFYFDNCPEDIAQSHDGNRFDSKDPLIWIPEYIQFLQRFGIDPKTKVGIPSDWLTAASTVNIFQKHKNDLWKLTFGNGTHLTNNTKGTRPKSQEPYGPFWSFSVVVKPNQVQRQDWTRVSCVKLSDNPNKATGDQERIQLFKNIFWTKGMHSENVKV